MLRTVFLCLILFCTVLPVHALSFRLAWQNSGLVACWDFNETSGSVVHDCVGSNDGTLYDGAVVYDGGSGGAGPNFTVGHTGVDNALGFNLNSSTINDAVRQDRSTDFTFEGDFTISGWFKADPLSTNSAQHASLFSDAVYDESGVNFILYRGNGGATAGKLIFGVKSPGAVDNCSLKSAARLDDSAWHWFAGVVRSQTMYLYVDGDFVDSLPYEASTTAAPAMPPEFGDPGLIGTLDDFAVFNYAVLGNLEGGQLYNLWMTGALSVSKEFPTETGLLLSTNTTSQGTQYYDMWNAAMPTSEDGGGYPILTNAAHNLVHYAEEETGGYNHKTFLACFNGLFYTAWANHPYGEDAPGQRCLLSVSSNATEWAEFEELFAAPDTIGAFTNNGLYFSPKPWRVRDGKLYGIATLYESIGWESSDGTSFSEIRDDDHTVRVVSRVVDMVREMVDGQPGTVFSLQELPEDVSLPFEVISPTNSAVSDAVALLLMPESGPQSQTGLPVPVDNAGLTEASFHEGQNGDWICLTRDDQYSHRMYAAFSDDQGVTWSPARPTNIPDSPSLTTSVTLSDGTVLLIGNQCATEFDNPISPKHYSRDPLVVSVSSDGYVFANPQALRTGVQTLRIPDVSGRGGGAQYPSAVVVGDRLYAAYSMGKEDIWVSVVDLKDVVP